MKLNSLAFDAVNAVLITSILYDPQILQGINPEYRARHKFCAPRGMVQKTKQKKQKNNPSKIRVL